MALPRSKSAPHMAAAGPTSLSSARGLTVSSHAQHPKMQRHSSALAVTARSYVSVYHAISSRSGLQAPRTDRIDDPFSLFGFFPASLTGPYRRPEHMEWDWLVYEPDDSDLVGTTLAAQSPTSSSPGIGSPLSSEEDDEERTLPSTPSLSSSMFDRGEDELCGETIRREDKLGVLSLQNPFLLLSEESANVGSGAFMPPPPKLLSPYSEDNPLDSDAVYNALCVLRNAHSIAERAPASGGTSPPSPGGLFSSVEEGGVVDSDLETLGTRGLGRLLDMLPL